MRRKIGMMAVLILSMALTACGQGGKPASGSESVNADTSGKEEQKPLVTSIASTPTETATQTPTQTPTAAATAAPTQEPTAIPQPVTTQPPVQEIYETGEFSFTIPSSWVGKYSVEVSATENGTWRSFYHTGLQNQGVGGKMVSIVTVSGNSEEIYGDNKAYLGEAEGKEHWMVGPTDVQFGSQDNPYAEEYHVMYEDRYTIIDTFCVKGNPTVNTAVPSVQPESSYYNYVDFYLPDSDRAYVTQSQLSQLTKEELELARNEIFARHGYAFQEERIRNYFESKPWYQATIQPADFYNQVTFNEYESKNIAYIQEEEARR